MMLLSRGDGAYSAKLIDLAFGLSIAPLTLGSNIGRLIVNIAGRE